jgi:hypothetical protein
MTAKRRVRGAETSPVTQPLNHISRQIPPQPHTPMYVWHKFWARKTWNVVAEYIKTYCPNRGIVLDPFAGSGVVAMETLKAGRKAIVCDLLPIATEITRLTIKPIEPEQLGQGVIPKKEVYFTLGASAWAGLPEDEGAGERHSDRRPSRY